MDRLSRISVPSENPNDERIVSIAHMRKEVQGDGGLDYQKPYVRSESLNLTHIEMPQAAAVYLEQPSSHFLGLSSLHEGHNANHHNDSASDEISNALGRGSRPAK